MNQLNRRSLLTTVGIGSLALATHAKATPIPRKRKIRVAQIGTNHAHATKLEVFRKSDSFEVVGIFESDSKLWEAKRELPAFRDLKRLELEQLLNWPDLEFVLIETDVCDLLKFASMCIQAGKGVHIDKPAGENLDQLKQILEHASEKNLLVQMGYMYRYNPGFRLAKDLLKKGLLGIPFEIEAVMSKVIAPPQRELLAKYPGGTMFELGCHLIDLVVDLLGPPDQVTPFGRKVADANDTLIDNMLAVFAYPKALATVKSSGVEVEGFARRHLTLCGTEGTIQIEPLDNPTVKIALAKPSGGYTAEYQTIKLPSYTRYVDDAYDVAAILLGEKKPEFSYAHDLAVQHAILQASGLNPKT